MEDTGNYGKDQNLQQCALVVRVLYGRGLGGMDSKRQRLVAIKLKLGDFGK